MDKKTIEEITEEVFREQYVPLYPKDKPITEMTGLEQGLFKQFRHTGFILIEKVLTNEMVYREKKAYLRRHKTY